MSISLSAKTNLAWPDYTFVAIFLILCMSVGIYFNRLKTKRSSLSEFLLASRNLSVFPVAVSIMATTFSAFSLTGVTGELYLYGVGYAVGMMFCSLGMIVAAYTLIPVFRKYQLVSVFELLERRFDRSTRRIFSLAYICQRLPFLCLVIYLPALSLTTLTPCDYRIITFVLGFVCTLYSSLGGFRTVIWTDVMQSFVMLITLFMIIFQGIVRIGFLDILERSIDNGYLTTFHWLDSENVRYSMWAVIVNGLLGPLDYFVINQAFVQRILGAKSDIAAKNSVILGGVLNFVFTFTLVVAAAVLYISYNECDPMMLSEYTGVYRLDQLFVYAIGDMFLAYPVLKGIAVTGIICASLSTFSSFINSFAAVAMEDFVKPMFPAIQRNDNAMVVVCMFLSFFFGSLATFGSFLMPLMGNAVRAKGVLTGIFRGPLTAAGLLALFWKKTTKNSCLFSLLVGVLVTSWVVTGNFLYVGRRSYSTLNMSTSNCEEDYVGWVVDNINASSMANDSYTGESELSNGMFMPFYKISFVWYTPIGLFTTLIAGLVYAEINEAYNGKSRRPKIFLLNRIDNEFDEDEDVELKSNSFEY